ncbi:zinc ABC transporter solute-binding protein|uniref:Zinc ABC transporter solute-binding protein n=1 Tax=Leuconostoc lactis TaxID=1246 RepID=A0A6L7A856_LEULA|nr:zinc ABC transporter solute-binding protein [Leuconostoc lactis]
MVKKLFFQINVQYLATNHAQQVFMTQLGYQPVQQDLASATTADFDTLAKKMQDHTIRFVLTASQDQSEQDQRVMLSDSFQGPDANNYWLSPQVILQTISRLSDLLSDLDPQNRDFYIRQSQQLLAQTQPLADGIARLQAESDRIAYQQLAKAIVAEDGRVTVLDGKLTTSQQKKQFKGAEVVLTDNHASPLLTQRQKLHLRSKILVGINITFAD